MTTVEQTRGSPVTAGAQSRELVDDRARAERVAIERRRRQALQNFGIRAAALAIALTLWQIVGINTDPVLFTTPIKVIVAAADMIWTGELWQAMAPSLFVLMIGLTLAITFGTLLGLLLARFRILDVALTVYITFLYSIPSVALVPLIVLWAGYETTAKVVILFLFGFFPMVINTYQGVKSVDAKLLEVGRAFRCSEGQLWANIVLPAALPFIVTGIRLAVGRGMIGMVLADLYSR